MVRVFCDFDGTVAAEDVGNRLFRHFAGPKAEEIVKGYLDGTKSAVECLSQECAAVGAVSVASLETFVDQFSLDPYFPGFVEFCRGRGMPITILSDGLDFYVGRLLRKYDLNDLPWFANHATFEKQGTLARLVPEFPYADSECLQCGNCKRNHMLTMSGDDDILVYVGDGISDRCPVRYADVVFAKRGLIKYCQSENITFYEFSTFLDVQQRVEKILLQKRIRKRREAEMARREVYLQG
ncbi:MAG: MtnX-like HAD-IB family phosphatase [Ignavibacteriales bacterium]|nr:MtnX-like HAD-IB family phosphatase [Ignavibacteriales bacterium]